MSEIPLYMHALQYTSTQDCLLKSTFTHNVNFKKLRPPMGVPYSEVEICCGRLTYKTNHGWQCNTAQRTSKEFPK